mmetsp:Transcript_24328/g.58717  ORF Transcript_24328/g.58717 Transcript_24328/m.58717 type:complete len:431 (+) Transcript_24328:219-1511(+)
MGSPWQHWGNDEESNDLDVDGGGFEDQFANIDPSVQRIKTAAVDDTLLDPGGILRPKEFRKVWPDDVLLVASDSNGQRIVKVLRNGTVHSLAGKKGFIGSQDGKGTSARFKFPLEIAEYRKGLLVCDSENHKIRRISPDGEVTTVVGHENYGNSQIQQLMDGPLSSAQFSLPSGITELKGDPQSSLKRYLIADAGSHSIRLLELATSTEPSAIAVSRISTVAGSLFASGHEDGAASTAKFCWPSSLAADTGNTSNGVLSYNVFVADTGNHCIRHFQYSPSMKSDGASSVRNSSFQPVRTIPWYSQPREQTSIDFRSPTSVSFNENTWYVANRGGATIHSIAVSTSGSASMFQCRTLYNAASPKSRISFVSRPRLEFPSPTAIHASGPFIYIGDSTYESLKKMTCDGFVVSDLTRHLRQKDADELVDFNCC